MRGWVYGGTLRDNIPSVKEPWSNRRSKYHYEHKTHPERHHGDAATSVAQLLISVVLFLNYNNISIFLPVLPKFWAFPH